MPDISDFPQSQDRASVAPVTKANRPASSTGFSRVSITKRGRERAREVIRFIERLTIPSGKGAGGPFLLEPFQKKFIRAIYEPHDVYNNRAVRRAILSMARKNGKTALIAALALVHLVGPEAITNGEIYSAANDRDQAAIVFKFARQMVELEPELMEKIQIVSSTKTMIGLKTGSVYRAVSAEAGTKHGYLPSVVIFDELAQAKNRNLYDVFDTAFGARDEPLFLIISTQSNDPDHVLSRLIDDGLSGVDPTIVCHLYAAKEDCELDDETEWKRANPALGKFRDRKDLALSVQTAMRMPSNEPTVRNLLLNQRVSPHATLISRPDWAARAGQVEFQDGEEVYLALDLSSVADLTALVMGSADDPIRLRPFFWKPEDYLELHSARDFGAGNLRYFNWAQDGHLLVCPGKTIDPIVVALKVAELTQTYNVRGMAYDRWHMKDFLRECDRIGLAAYEDNVKGGDGLRIVPWGQGYKDMTPAVAALERAVIDSNLIHDGNPVLTWNVSNAVVTTDPAGNRKLDKEAAKFRIDGAVAMAMMVGLRSRDVQSQVDIAALLG